MQLTVTEIHNDVYWKKIIVHIIMQFFTVILLAAFPVIPGTQIMFTAAYLEENDSGTRVEVGNMWVDTNWLRLSTAHLSTAFLVTYAITKARRDVRGMAGIIVHEFSPLILTVASPSRVE